MIDAAYFDFECSGAQENCVLSIYQDRSSDENGRWNDELEIEGVERLEVAVLHEEKRVGASDVALKGLLVNVGVDEQPSMSFP